MDAPHLHGIDYAVIIAYLAGTLLLSFRFHGKQKNTSDYFFGSGKDFKRIAHQLLIDGTHGKAEFYVSLLYNYLLAEGKTVRLAPMEEYYSYGTPEELMRFM